LLVVVYCLVIWKGNEGEWYFLFYFLPMNVLWYRICLSVTPHALARISSQLNNGSSPQRRLICSFRVDVSKGTNFVFFVQLV
jgi:hypothetical protein